jgi:hypothetical protein
VTEIRGTAERPARLGKFIKGIANLDGYARQIKLVLIVIIIELFHYNHTCVSELFLLGGYSLLSRGYVLLDLTLREESWNRFVSEIPRVN